MKLTYENELFETIKDFLHESSDKYSNDVCRAKYDLNFYGGNSWEYVPDQLLRKSRANLSFSELPKYVQAIKSSAQKCPYHNQIESDPNTNESRDIYDELQTAIDRIENASNYKQTLIDGLESCIITGNGPILLTTTGVKDDVKIEIEHIRDISTVAFDPNCTKFDMSDAEQGAIVSFIPKRKAKRQYGEEVCDIDSRDLNFGNQWTIQPNTVSLITYYELVEEGCRVVKMIGKYIISEDILPISRIPIYKLTGYSVYRNNAFTSVGIVDRVKDLQIGANIGYSSLIERMNRSPKAGFICTAESINGVEKEIPKLSSGEVPLFVYKAGTDKPEQIRESFEVGDLQAVVNSSLELMSATIGIPRTGVEGINNLTSTATEALLKQENSESNVGCFYESLQEVSKAIGETILELYGVEKGSVSLKQVNGPNTITRNAKRRNDLLQLAGLVPDQFKPLIAKYYAETLDDSIGNDIADNITANLDPSIQLVKESEDPLALHQMNQAKQLIDQQQGTIADLQAQIAQLTKENETLNISMIDNREARALEYTKMMLDQQKEYDFKQAELALKSEEVANKFATDQEHSQLKAAEIYYDNIRSNNELLVEMTNNKELPIIAQTEGLYTND
jgi:hypothetical protein